MSAGFEIRPAAAGNLEDMISCWTRSFGDGRALVGDMIESGGLMEHAVAAEAEGRICGAFFCFDGLRFGALGAGYLYALCVLPEYRGRGAGAALVRAAARRCFERGADLVLTVPGDTGLERWYRRSFGMEVLIRTEEVPVAPVAVSPGADCVPISYEEYARLRGGGNAGVPLQMLAAQAAIFRRTGGGFFRAGDALVCAEPRPGGGVLVRELLRADGNGNGNGNADAALSAVADRFGGGPLYSPRAAAEGTALLYLTRDGLPPPEDAALPLPFPLD